MIATHLLVDGERLCKSTYPRANETDDPGAVTCRRCRFLHWDQQQPLEDAYTFVDVLEEIVEQIRWEHQHSLMPRHAWCKELVERLGGQTP